MALASGFHLMGQDNDNNVFNPLSDNISSLLPPLETLIDSAISHSAEIKFWDAGVKAKESKILSEKRLWLRNLGISTDLRYGTYDNLSLSESPAGTPVTVYSNQIQTRYGGAVYFKLPLSDMADRKNQIRFAEFERKQSIYSRESKKDDIRKEVIIQYNQLLLSQKLLKIQASNLQSSNVNLQMAEKKFQNSEINVSELSSITEINSRALSAFETAKSDFVTNYMMLQELTGIKFNLSLK